MREGAAVSEGLVAQIWRGLGRHRFYSSQGKGIEVLHPGRQNGDCGPDFKGAIVVEEGELCSGDVELHVRASDWRAHRHHRDPRYNGVILQVVLWDDGAAATLQNGKAVPTLALLPWLGSLEEVRRWAGRSQGRGEPCRQAASYLGDALLGRLLDQAGEQRFHLKAAHFREGIGNGQAAQVLYQGLMGALGYAKNKERFQELACRLPLSVLQSAVQGLPGERRLSLLQSLLLGTAGLLPSQRGRESPEEVAELDRLWHSHAGSIVLSDRHWRLFRVRPGNHPTRRLVAASYLLSRFLDQGLPQSVLRLVLGGLHCLEQGFVISAQGYWAGHFDFGCRIGNPSLIGRGRARDIVVNVVLPFAWAWAQVGGEPELERNAWELYRRHPRLAENAITRGMARLLLGRCRWMPCSAQRQQGLLHLFHSFCREGNCAQCPVVVELSLT